MKKTRIEWCDSSFNPVTGCRHACPYCYARTMVNRFSKAVPDGKLHVLDEPVIRDGKADPYPCGFDPTYHRYRLGQIRHMAGWKPSNIFICSMADIFGSWVPEEWITEITGELRKVEKHNYLFLTKNPMRYYELMSAGKLPEDGNFWYGTTVTTGNSPYFFNKGANTFLSIEPILEDFELPYSAEPFYSIDWVIIGAETGNRRGKVIPKKEWINNIVECCDKAGIPVFMKDSLIPIIGEENMRRDMPEGLSVA